MVLFRKKFYTILGHIRYVIKLFEKHNDNVFLIVNRSSNYKEVIQYKNPLGIQLGP